MEHLGNSHIEGIQNEYRRINAQWLRTQYRMLIWLALFTAAMETVMFFVLDRIDAITTSSTVYLLKYLVAPSGCNLAICAAAVLLMRSRQSDKWKMYAVSLLTVVMAFLVYSFHSVFYPLFLVFVIPMLLTTAYGERKLTTVTGVTCVISKAASDLFLRWDPQETYVLSSRDALVNFGLSLVLLALFYVVCLQLLTVEQEKNEASINLERERQRYQEEAVTDSLTRVGNRQALRAAFQRMEEMQDSQRYFLAMMDLDDFKQLNDTFGHSQGDRYLQAMGEVLRQVATDRIQPFRFGGDEFCVLFRDCGREEVYSVCRSIQERFRREEIHWLCKSVSVSIGAAEHLRGERPARLLDRADTALYQAKQEKGSVYIEKA